MIAENTDSEPIYRVSVHAIVGGPFDLRENDILRESETFEWREPLLRLGALEPICLN